MSAAQIVEEIKCLSPEEQAAAVRLVYQLDAERKLSGRELSSLAERFVNEQGPVEASRVRQRIVQSFYGAQAAWQACADLRPCNSHDVHFAGEGIEPVE